MGGVGSDRRSAWIVRDAHNRRLDPDNPDDLEAMAVSHHKALVQMAFAKAVRGRNVGADLAELLQFEDAAGARR